MANISDTTGTVTIVADTKADLLKILSIISREQSNYWYATNYLGDLTSDDIWFDKMEQKFRATIDFAAEGRWTYQCNLENFGAWLDSSLSEIDKNEDKIYLESHNWEFIFDYYDFDPGCWFLMDADRDQIVHKSGTPLSETEYLEGSHSFLEVTRENLIEYLSYDKDDLELIGLESKEA